MDGLLFAGFLGWVGKGTGDTCHLIFAGQKAQTSRAALCSFLCTVSCINYNVRQRKSASYPTPKQQRGVHHPPHIHTQDKPMKKL
eukprot:1947422-Amphidinium_carterae.2